MTLSLGQTGRIWVGIAFAAGLVAASLWASSSLSWQRHLTRAYLAGHDLYAALTLDRPAPEGLRVTRLPPDQQVLADAGAFDRLPGGSRPAYVTHLSTLADPPRPGLMLAVVSDKLRYPVAALSPTGPRPGGQVLGGLARSMAQFCAVPVLYAKPGTGAWLRIEGDAIWTCAAAPRDLRLWAAGLAAVSLAGLLGWVGAVAAPFSGFARALSRSRRADNPAPFPATGPRELRQIVSAVNHSLDEGRAQLENRALVLSGVSHDLGTPATRLRLRAALIGDDDLRTRLIADIDQMTDMIESVLTYTRSEMNREDPRDLSLTALLEAIVSDYHDTGHRVVWRGASPVAAQVSGTVFSARAGHGALTDARRVLVRARPVALRRAVSNLIDNALKYGRGARVWLEPAADTVQIVVEDDSGPGARAGALNALAGPFRRGDNTGPVPGFGLGLTIVRTVAQQHGGALSFADGPDGLRAVLEIRRG